MAYDEHGNWVPDSNSFSAQDIPWGDAPQGMKSWWEAGEPRNLDFNWQSGRGSWWPDPDDWGEHINTIRDTGEGVRRWEDMPSYQDIPSSAYTWEKTGRTGEDFPIENIGDWRNLQTRYGSEMGFGDESPWGPGQALYRGANIGHHQTEFNQNMENFRIASEMAHQDWQNRPDPPDPNEAARLACLAKGDGSTWDGQNCIPPQPPTPTGEAACVAGGGTWSNPGGEGTCKPKTVIDEGAEECASRGAPWFWNGTSCVLQQTDLTTDLQQQCRDAGGDWYGGACHFDDTRNPGVPGSSTFDKYPGWPGVDETGTIESDDASIPAVDPDVQEFFTHDVGTDPMSQITNLALSNLVDTGGVVSTPFTAQTEGKLSDIMANEGYLPPTDYERDLKQQYQGVIDEGGVQPLTDLERETQENLWELINRGGQIPLDEQRRAMQIESARSPIDSLRRAQLSQGQAAMAGRGTLGQGPETDYMQRVESKLAPMYAQAAQSIALEEAQAADDRYQTALQQLNQQALQGRISADQHAQQARNLQSAMAIDIARRQDDRLMTAIQTSADLTTAQSANLVDAVNAMTGVQQMRTDSAIRVLDQNRLWNQFLAEYGLDRAKTLNEMQQGRYLHLMPMIQQFMNMLQITTGGFVDQS